VIAVASCLATERLFCWLAGRPSSLSDGSVIITGILLALTLPPGFPLWMTAAGGFVSVALGKMLFGGLGFNSFNPALVGRAFLQASFPVAITGFSRPLLESRFSEFSPSTLAFPFLQPARIDAISSATPLTQQKFDHVTTASAPLFFGAVSGSAGETPALLILLCGAYLIVRKMMDWRIPAAMLGAAFLLSGLFYWINPTLYPAPVFTLLSGGLMLGAMFMATDMVGSPVTPLGVWIYGALMGVITVIIRIYGGLPEGVMYAILLGNAVSPLVDNLTQPRIYGARKREAARA
jgi:electron transport complex protein RnfD